MASLKKDPASGKYRIHFWFGGKQFQKSLKTTDETEAEEAYGRISLMLRELRMSRKTLPPEADFWEYVFSDGARLGKPTAPAPATLEQLFNRYVDELPQGAMEANSLQTHKHHSKHLLRLLGPATVMQSLGSLEIQRYVTVRSKEKYRDRPISPQTIRKEIIRFKVVWNWAKDKGFLSGDAPTKKLKYPKADTKRPFQTWQAIEKTVLSGKLSPEEIEAQWKSLFLRREEIDSCLDHVKNAKAAPFVYPMFVFIAHTGARRSEMMRSRVEDFDLEARKVIIREKKKKNSVNETQRRVNMSSLLVLVMKDWLTNKHPGGPFSFCLDEVVSRSKTRSKFTGYNSGPGRPTSGKERVAALRVRTQVSKDSPLTESQADKYFRKGLEGSKWAVLTGFHVFRHSFASNLAQKGTRPDVIDGLMGHQTEEMRNRYRHQFPEEPAAAIDAVFG